jgi:hypothetical protein
MSNPTRTRKTSNVPVILYPEGVIVGHVRTGKTGSSGKVRHVATTEHGVRIGTFDLYREAADALLADARRRSAYAKPAAESTEHRVELIEAPAERAGYGIMYLSRYVFRTSKGSSPTRVLVWSNLGRPNTRNGEPVKFGDYGPINGGDGAFLDPQNRATDDAQSVLLTPECSVITNNGTNTGTEASGQVYAPAGTRIAEGDLITLVYPDGIEATYVARFTNNGHGRLAPTEQGPTPTRAPETTTQRRERLAAELVAETVTVSPDHRYARAYGILAGLVRGMLDDAEGRRAGALAREYVRQMDAYDHAVKSTSE